MTFFSNLVHQFSTVHGIDLVFSAYYADISCRQSHVGVFWYHFLFINFQGHKVKILSDVKSFFEIFFVLDLGRKKAHIKMCASSIWRFGHKNKINTINTVQVMDSSSSSLTEVQARRRRSILVMMTTQITSSESRSLVLQEQKKISQLQL